MQHRKLFVAIALAGIGIVVAAAIALVVVQPAAAQCGSQASSCKNCHETQAKKPVNNDGTGWHQSHAFGDFCYICHGGNNQATDETAAHAGMVAPLSDIQAACAQCHPNDLQARAQVYAVKLGVEAGSAAAPQSAPTATSTAAAAGPGPTPQAAALAAPWQTIPGSQKLEDYVARYNERVLHQEPTNRGNVILVILLVALILIGIFFVNKREGWIRISLIERKPLQPDLPADVAGIAEQVSRLNPGARKSLAHLLERPAATSQLLSALERLSTDQPSGDK